MLTLGKMRVWFKIQTLFDPSRSSSLCEDFYNVIIFRSADTLSVNQGPSPSKISKFKKNKEENAIRFVIYFIKKSVVMGICDGNSSRKKSQSFPRNEKVFGFGVFKINALLPRWYENISNEILPLSIYSFTGEFQTMFWLHFFYLLAENSITKKNVKLRTKAHVNFWIPMIMRIRYQSSIRNRIKSKLM